MRSLLLLCALALQGCTVEDAAPEGPEGLDAAAHAQLGWSGGGRFGASSAISVRPRDLSVPRDLTVLRDFATSHDGGPDLVGQVGDGGYAIGGATISQFVRIKSPQPGMHFTTGKPLRILADGIDNQGNQWGCGHNDAKTVYFYIDGVLQASVNQDCANINSYETRPSSLTVGPHVLTTKALICGNTGCFGGGGTTIDGSNVVTIWVDAAPSLPSGTTTISSNLVLSGSTPLTWDNQVVTCTGHSTVTGTTTGAITCRNSYVSGCGDFGVNGIDLTTTGAVSIENCIFEATGAVRIVANGSNAVTVTDSEWRANNWITYTAGNPDDSPTLDLSGSTSGAKTMKGNRFGGGIVSIDGMNGWQVGGLTNPESNILMGPRAVLRFHNSSSAVVQGNYMLHDYHGGWSQGFNLEAIPNIGSGHLAEHNVIRGGSWPVQSWAGTFRYNLVTQAGHDWIRSLDVNASVHHNVFTANDENDGSNGGVLLYLGETGVNLYNNTFDGNSSTLIANSEYWGFASPALAISSTVTVASVRSNVFNDFMPVANFGDGIVACGSGPTCGSVTSADYNLFYKPNAGGGIANYSASLTIGGSHTHDVTAAPSWSGGGGDWLYPIDEGAVWNKTLGVSAILARYRTRFTPAGGSPLIGAGDPADCASNFIGAIGTGGCASLDKFGTTMTDGPHVLLTQGDLVRVRAEAAAATTKATTFKASLDTDLPYPAPAAGGDYQGSNLQRIADYALGYQMYKFADATAAKKYAGKARGLLRSALVDYQHGYTARQYLARGDGSTTAFALPRSDYVSSTFKAFVVGVSTTAVTKGAANGQDDIGLPAYWKAFLKVSNTPDGVASYVKGTDWAHSGDYGWSFIDWSSGGAEPAPGATYYVTLADYDAMGAPVAGSLSGGTFTFSVAPASGAAIFIEATEDAACSTVDCYGQTSASEGGGFNSINVDTTYTSRNLAAVAWGLDWLADDPAFPSQLRTDAQAMLVRWADYLAASGYLKNTWTSNYGDGHWALRYLGAMALMGRHPQGNRLVADALAWRTANLLPQMTGGQPSVRGGWWSEGESYSINARINGLVPSIAGRFLRLNDSVSEVGFIDSSIEALFGVAVSETEVYNGGDGFAANGQIPMPSKTLWYLLASQSSNAADRGYANYLIQNYAGSQAPGWGYMLWYNPAATTTNPTALPLGFYADGTGLVTARETTGYSGTFVTFQLGNLLGNDHQSYAPGQLQIYRGSDHLLANAPAWWGQQDPHKGDWTNGVVVSDNGAGCGAGQGQVYSTGPGVWYGSPGVVLSAVDLQSAYVAAWGDAHAAYGCNSNPGVGSTSALWDSVLYVRPDKVYRHHLVTTNVASFTKRLLAHVVGSPTLSGSNGSTTSKAWSAVQGSGKLFGQTFASVNVDTTSTGITTGGQTIYEVDVHPSSASTTSVRYSTVYQSKSSGTSSPDTTAAVTDSNSNMEGVAAGTSLALFTIAAAALSTSATVAFTAPAGVTAVYLVNVQPSRSYTLTGASSGSATSSSKGVLAFSLGGGGGAVTVH